MCSNDECADFYLFKVFKDDLNNETQIMSSITLSYIINLIVISRYSNNIEFPSCKILRLGWMEGEVTVCSSGLHGKMTTSEVLGK